MLFCWYTTRRREVSLGYGWLLRIVYGLMAAIAAIVGLRYGLIIGREIASIGVAVACAFGLVVSVVRRRAGVSGHIAEHDRRTARVAAMTGIDRGTTITTTEERGAELPPVLDLVPALIGGIGLVFAAVDAAESGGGDVALSIARTLIGAAFLGCISDAMLLGHWYLTQPGLPRRLLNELVTALGWVWPLEIIVLLIPTGMVSVWNGTIDDGWGGMLGWFWAACAVTTIALVYVTKAALKEREYSAVMAATGLLYLAILTAFGTDIVARAVLA